MRSPFVDTMDVEAPPYIQRQYTTGKPDVYGPLIDPELVDTKKYDVLNEENEFGKEGSFETEWESSWQSAETERETEDAVSLNTRYSNEIGWIKYVYLINDLLLSVTGRSDQSLGGADFASAVYTWKLKNGFSGSNNSGVIDIAAWNIMKPQLSALLSSNIVKTWGSKEELAADLDRLVYLNLPDDILPSVIRLSAAQKVIYSKQHAILLKMLFEERRNLVSSGYIPPLGRAKVPFGFYQTTYGVMTGLGSYGSKTRFLGSPRTDITLAALYRQGRINITQDELDILQRISDSETYGMIQLFNSYDSAVVTIGFMQFTLHVGKIQEWIKLNEPAFRKYGIELDPIAKYRIGKDNVQTAIKGARQASDLRWNGWAERFYYAGLDTDVVIAEVQLALVYLKRHLSALKSRLKNDRKYNLFYNSYYTQDPYVRGLFQTSFNNNPALSTRCVDTAISAFATPPSIPVFLEKYKSALISAGKQHIVDNTARGTDQVIDNVGKQHENNYLAGETNFESPIQSEDEYGGKNDFELEAVNNAYENYSPGETDHSGEYFGAEEQEQETNLENFTTEDEFLQQKGAIQAAILSVANTELGIWKGKKETDSGMYAHVKRYWVEGVNFPPRAADTAIRERIAHPGTHEWSAAFISYVMRKAANNNFLPSTAHNRYAKWAFDNRQAASQERPFWMYKIDEVTLEVGDIILNARNLPVATYDTIVAGVKGGRQGHGDIVIAVNRDNNTVTVVGGNKRQNVETAVREMTTEGKIKQQTFLLNGRRYDRYIGVVKLMPDQPDGFTLAAEGETDHSGEYFGAEEQETNFENFTTEDEFVQQKEAIQAAITTVANDEVVRWKDKTETDPGMYDYIKKYWIEGVSLTPGAADKVIRERKKYVDKTSKSPIQEWSAAFVSYVMRKATNNNFLPSSAHNRYAKWAFDNRQSASQDRPFWMYKIDEVTLEVGDIILNARNLPVATYDTIVTGVKGGLQAHGDIVIAVDKANNTVTVVGGNVDRKVKARPMTVNADGKIKQQTFLIKGRRYNRYIGVIKLMPDQPDGFSLTQPDDSHEIDNYDYSNEKSNESQYLPDNYLSNESEEEEYSSGNSSMLNEGEFALNEWENEHETGAAATPSIPKLMGDDTAMPGYTCYVNINIVKGSAMLNQTAIYIPSTFDPSQPVDVVLYMHGILNGHPGASTTIDQYLKAHGSNFDFRLREEVNNSSKNIILVAPYMGVVPKIEYNFLSDPNGFDIYIGQTLLAVNEYVILKRFSASPINFRNIILAAHSGSGKQMIKIVAEKNPIYGPAVWECWGFDCLYQDATILQKWANANYLKRLFIYYTEGTATNSHNLASLPNKAKNIFIIKTGVSHSLIPKRYLEERIVAITGMQKTDNENFEDQRNYENEVFASAEWEGEENEMNEVPVSAAISVTQAPQFINEDNPLSGYTFYVKINIGNGNYPLDKTGIYIPSSFDPSQPVDVIVYLHGMTGEIPGSNAMIDTYWNSSGKKDGIPYDLRLRDEVERSGKNVIFVAPSLGASPNDKSYINSLRHNGGFDTFMTQALSAVNEYVIQKRFDTGSIDFRKVILAAHSAGGELMRTIAADKSVTNPAYRDRITECWGFDCLYSGVAAWITWAKNHPGQKLFLYFLGSTRENSIKLDRHTKGLGNVFIKQSTAQGHYLVPKEHLKERIVNIGL